MGESAEHADLPTSTQGRRKHEKARQKLCRFRHRNHERKSLQQPHQNQQAALDSRAVVHVHAGLFTSEASKVAQKRRGCNKGKNAAERNQGHNAETGGQPVQAARRCEARTLPPRTSKQSVSAVYNVKHFATHESQGVQKI